MAALVSLQPAPSSASERRARALVVQQCFAPAALAARDGEQRPLRGAPGHNAAIPRMSLAPHQPIPDGLRGAVRRVDLPAGKKLVALTLDLCEQSGEVAGYDGAIFDYLRAQGVPATLFIGGKWLVTHADRSRQLLADPLFEVGNHGWAHRNLRALDAKGLATEIRGAQVAYEATRAGLAAAQCVADHPGAQAGMATVPARLALFRFPYGACNAAALQAVADNGLLAIQWDVSTGDPAPAQSGQAIARQMLTARPGSIIIAHANGRGYHTAAGLRIAIPQLKARGYTFVTVSELLAAGRPVIEQRCYDARPGDTDRYDFLFQRRPAP